MYIYIYSAPVGCAGVVGPKERFWGEAISFSVFLWFACSLAFPCSETLSHCAHPFRAQLLISLIIITSDFYQSENDRCLF